MTKLRTLHSSTRGCRKSFVQGGGSAGCIGDGSCPSLPTVCRGCVRRDKPHPPRVGIRGHPRRCGPAWLPGAAVYCGWGTGGSPSTGRGRQERCGWVESWSGCAGASAGSPRDSHDPTCGIWVTLRTRHTLEPMAPMTRHHGYTPSHILEGLEGLHHVSSFRFLFAGPNAET